MTSHENILKEALVGLSKLQLPISKELSEKEKATLAASIERGLEKSPKEDMGREVLEEALSFVQGKAEKPGQEEMPMEEEDMPEEKPMGLMSRRGTEDGV